MKNIIAGLMITLTLSACTVELFKTNPLNGCSSQKAGRWCSPSEAHIKLIERDRSHILPNH